jgi:hypoxanthine phosphoribosyltransferase
MQTHIEEVLISHGAIARRVKQLAEQITADHTAPNLEGAEISIVPIMTGAMIFASDLIRQIPIAMKIGLMMVSSYPGKSLQSRGAQMLAQQVGDIAGRHVLVLDDILDSGGTIQMVVPALRDLGAASVKSCVLLRKDRPQARATQVDYVGFEIPDKFVVGYGLDYNDYYRNLPDIVTLKEQITLADQASLRQQMDAP